MSIVLFSCCGVSAPIATVMDARDGAAIPGATGQSIGILLTNADGLSSFEFTLALNPQGLLSNLHVERGAQTQGFEIWEDSITDQLVQVAGGTSQNPVSMTTGKTSEIARLVFDVAPGAVEGTTVALVIGRAATSLPFDLFTDLGTVYVGFGPAPMTQRRMELEMVPNEVFPGDTVQLNVYVHDVPQLSSAQIFLDYPEEALSFEGEVGGHLVETLGWVGSFVRPKQIGDRPYVLVDRLFGNAESPGLGRILAATVPFRVGADWGGDWRGFEVHVDDIILFGDLLSGDENLYHARNEDTAIQQEPPDFNGDGVLDFTDFVEFGQHWRNVEGSR